MPKKVLIVTSHDEISAPLIEKYLQEMGQDYFRLNVDSIVQDNVMISLDQTKSQVNGLIKSSDGEVEVDCIKSVWFRRPKPVSAQGSYGEKHERSFVEGEYTTALWSLYTSLEDVFWMNHPVAARILLESNKILQLKLASSAGLATPDTLVSNNPEEVLEFCKNHGGYVAVKPMGKATLWNERGTTSGIYTNRVSLDYLVANCDGISAAPLMVQEYVPKKVELRITVVGNRMFNCVIHSQDSDRTIHDWRKYDFENVKHEQWDLPQEIQAGIRNFMARCGLTFGAIDMILTPDERYVFLEVNPSGQFGWIEELTKLPISEGIALSLINCS